MSCLKSSKKIDFKIRYSVRQTCFAYAQPAFSIASGNIHQDTQKHQLEFDMDRYTKTVLTIIAISLLWITMKDTRVISNAVASSGVVEVKIVDMNWTRYKPLPVRIEGKISCD